MKTTIGAIDARTSRLNAAADEIRAACARESEALAALNAALAARDALAKASEAALAQLEPVQEEAEPAPGTKAAVARAAGALADEPLEEQAAQLARLAAIRAGGTEFFPVRRPGKRPVMVSVPGREDEPQPAPAKRKPGRSAAQLVRERNGRASK